MTAWLVTWLWQGLVVAGAAGVGSRVVLRERTASAAVRYAGWGMVLLAVLWLGYATFPTMSPIESGAEVARSPASTPWFDVPAPSTRVAWTVLWAWVGLTVLGLYRVAFGWVRMSAAKRSARPLPPTREARLAGWRRMRASGRQARLVVSDQVRGAAVLGLWRPRIAVSPALVRDLTDAELDHVVLHELGHVRRWDDWARLTQVLTVAFAGVHPAVRIIARALDREREAACDEWVVARTGRPRAYAKCLLRAAESSRLRQPRWAPALFGVEGGLAPRVERILRGPVGRSRVRGAAVTVACALALAAGVAMLRSTPVLVGVRAQATSARAPIDTSARAPIDTSARPPLERTVYVPVRTLESPPRVASATGAVVTAASVTASVVTTGGATADVAGDTVPSTLLAGAPVPGTGPSLGPEPGPFSRAGLGPNAVTVPAPAGAVQAAVPWASDAEPAPTRYPGQGFTELGQSVGSAMDRAGRSVASGGVGLARAFTRAF